MNLIHDSKARKFYYVFEGMECYVEYMISEDGAWDFYHTFVPMKLRGKGITRGMYDEIVKFLDKNNIRIKASCFYAEKYFNEEKNKKFFVEAA